MAAGNGNRNPEMPQVLASLALALGQLADGRVLRILIKSVAISLLLCIAIVWAGSHLIGAWLAEHGISDTLFTGAGAVRSALATLLSILGIWLVWRIVAMGVIQFFADDVVAAVESRYYPAAAKTARDPSLGAQLSSGLGAAGRALLANLAALPVAAALLFTAIGPALVFFVVNAWLLGRELQDMVWVRHRRGRDDASPVTRAERFVLGGAVAAMLTLPFVNFLAPVLGAASATHLVHRKDRS